VRTIASLHLSRLLILLLLTGVSCQLAIAQAGKGAPTQQPSTSAPTKTEQPPQATPSAESTAASESTVPATETRPAKEAEPLPFALEDVGETNREVPSAAGLLFRTLGALLLIVGLIVAVSWGLRRFGGGRFGTARKEGPALNVITTVSLGSRRSLAVVRFGERNLLIGTTAQTVTLLAAEDALSGEVQTPTPRSVADLLKADEAKEFEHELSEASEKLDDASSGWRADGGEV